MNKKIKILVKKTNGFNIATPISDCYENSPFLDSESSYIEYRYTIKQLQKILENIENKICDILNNNITAMGKTFICLLPEHKLSALTTYFATTNSAFDKKTLGKKFVYHFTQGPVEFGISYDNKIHVGTKNE
jgi:hypothetical protein